MGEFDDVLFQENCRNPPEIPFQIEFTEGISHEDGIRVAEMLSSRGFTLISRSAIAATLKADRKILEEVFHTRATSAQATVSGGMHGPRTVMVSLHPTATGSGGHRSLCPDGEVSTARRSPDEGALYPCHRFVGGREFRMGDVWQGITDRDLWERFRSIEVNGKEKCRGCWAKYLCGGGCHRHAADFNGCILEPYDIECRLVKWRIELAAYLFSVMTETDRKAIRGSFSAAAVRRPEFLEVPSILASAAKA